MGFGFNLIGFPVLILLTLGLLTHFIATKKKSSLKILGFIWILTIVVIVAASINSHYRTPMRLTKTDITGDYRIDTNFFPGRNANWQFDHYRFTITPTDSIFFYVTNRDTIIRIFREKIEYSSGPPDLWAIKSDTHYHVIKYGPTLYRGHNKFYYVFKSAGDYTFRRINKSR